MHVGRRLAAFLALTAAVPAFASGYRPVSDAVLGPVLAKPKSPSEVTAMCDRRIAAIGTLQAKVEAMPLSTPPATLLAAYDDLYNLAVSSAFAEPWLIKDTNPDAAIRAAAELCLQRSSQAATRFQMSPPIYQRLQAVERAGVAPGLRYSLARQLDNFRRAGVDKDEAARKRIEQLQNAITETGIEFDRNINSDLAVVKVKPEELAGLPQDYLDGHKPGADGLVEIKMTGADISPLFRYADSAALRKQVQTAWLSRAFPANDAVLKRLFAQRAELASLLGYPSFAAFDLANRMARDPSRTEAFVAQISAAARPVGEKEAARMLARLRKGDPSLARLGGWDISYATRLVRKEDYDVDPAVVRQYFSFDKVRTGIFSLTQDLFGVEIRPWSTEVWSPGVKAYELVEGGKVIGRFYLDMHPRDNKYTHAAMFPVRVGIKGRVLPVAALITNFPDGLMEHGQVQTFLHEFGHLLHWLFAGQREWAMQNFGEVENDVLEAPSTLLEEWVWDYETLAKFANDPQGRPIPRELVDKMVAGRNFGRAFNTMTDLALAAVALDYYSADMSGVDLTQRFKQTFDRYALAPDSAESHPQTSFGHLSGYGASYYTYQWSQALSADLLSRFRKAGLRDTATARAYRDLILAPGGSESMNVLARKFLGRDWSADAYRRELEAGSD